MSDFLARHWLWLAVVLIVTPLITIAGLIWLRAWLLSFGAWMKGVQIGITELMLLRLRRVDTTLLVNQLLVAKQNGLEVDAATLAAHLLAGGNIRVVVAALVSAKRFAIPLTLERACAIELVGEDPVRLIADAVHESGRIAPPSGDGTAPAHAGASHAGALLLAAPGSTGVVADVPRLTARIRFPQGVLDAVVRGRTVPNPGDVVRVAQVDGVTVEVEPTRA